MKRVEIKNLKPNQYIKSHCESEEWIYIGKIKTKGKWDTKRTKWVAGVKVIRWISKGRHGETSNMNGYRDISVYSDCDEVWLLSCDEAMVEAL